MPLIFHTHEQYWFALVNYKLVANCCNVVSIKYQLLYVCPTLIKDITLLCLVFKCFHGLNFSPLFTLNS